MIQGSAEAYIFDFYNIFRHQSLSIRYMKKIIKYCKNKSQQFTIRSNFTIRIIFIWMYFYVINYFQTQFIFDKDKIHSYWNTKYCTLSPDEN